MLASRASNCIFASRQRKDTMSDIVQVELGAPGAAFIRSRIEGDGAISRRLLQRGMSFEKAFAPLPTGTRAEWSARFAYGGVTTLRESFKWLATYLAHRFGREAECACLSRIPMRVQRTERFTNA